MKIRIKDNSVRFRITLKEVEQLKATGRIEKTTEFPGGQSVFTYAVRLESGLDESRMELDGSSIVLHLDETDSLALFAPEEEGAYLRTEWRDDEGGVHRFMAMIEKDRPGSTCIKKEAWIYEESRSGPDEVRPIPKDSLR